MKNHGVNFLLCVTVLFVGITLGFFWGRNYNHAPVQQSVPTPSATDRQAEEPTVPPETQATASTVANVSTAPAETTVNINTADLEQLVTLPGIGPVLAQRIIDYRTENGAFATPEELLNVSGIGEKRLEAIWDLVTVGG